MMSLSTIIKCLQLALGPEMEEFVSIFIDNILLVSKSFEEHMKYLNIVFDKLQKANLVVKNSKCEFCKSEIKFLGHIINVDRISKSRKYS